MGPNQDLNKYRPEDMDENLQRELEEALGDMSLEDILEAERAPRGPASTKPTGEGVRLGQVISIQGDDIFVDMGGKSQGILPAHQFEDEPLPAEGDTIEVTIQGYKGDEGLLILSRKGAILAASWERLEPGLVVEGRVTGHNKGGLELSLDGIRAFMPISQVDLNRVEEEELGAYTDRKLLVEVVEVRQGDNVVVSRRNVLQVEAEQNKAKMLEELKEGDTVDGTVRSLMPYGAFVDIGGVDGLLHVSDMSYSRVEDPASVVQVGDHVRVKVLKLDREKDRISLGLKQAMPDPWAGVAEKYPPNELVSGRVTRLADFGAFVELEAGVEGLIPIGELTFERRVRHPSDVLKEGDVVRVRVLSVEPDRNRISLSLKRAGEDPWIGASVRWAENTMHEGIVKRATEFGAFVELAPGVEGLVHISELADGFVRSVGEVVREADKVTVRILSVDEERRRIALSMKQSTGAAEPAAPATDAYEPPPAPRKRKKPLKGGLD